MVTFSSDALAQDDDDMDSFFSDTPAPQSAPAAAPRAEDSQESAAPSRAPVSPEEEMAAVEQDVDVDRLAIFVLQRGFYVSSDLGVFFTLAGESGISNAQPYLSVRVGYDINDFIGGELQISGGYAANNPPSPGDDPLQSINGQQSASYGLVNASGVLVLAFRPSERFALEPRLGGGLSMVNPALTSPNDELATLSTTLPHIMGGVDFKYLTLLTDFTAGLGVTAYYVLQANVPAVAASFIVRYTF